MTDTKTIPPNGSEKAPVSVVVLAKNEAGNIVRCIEALQWADEVVVVDDGSTDETVSLATSHGARVVDHRFESFAAQRNWALRHVDLRNDWVLMLDADEVATPEFASDVRGQISRSDRDTVAFRTCRKTMLDDVWLRHSDGFPVWIMRIVRRGRAEFEDSGHGEVPVPVVDGKVGTINEPFLHYAFSRGMDDWWQRHVRYAGREASQEQTLNENHSITSLFSRDSSVRRRGLRSLARSVPFRGTLRFLYQYFLRRGFMDGHAGFRFCKMMACYENMIAIRKLEPPQRKQTG